MQNRTLVILGMHRSGTSLITRWLYNCGLQVGEHLLGPGLGNDEGHFEDTDFYNLHLEILKDNNLHDSGIITGPVDHIFESRREQLKKLIASRNASFEQWGWKDPRTCLFPDLYRNLLPDAFYLVVIRDYQSVVISLLKRTFAELDVLYDANKGYLSKWAWSKFTRKRRFEKFCRSKAEFFLQVWVHYNEMILKNLQSIRPEKYLVINYAMLINEDLAVISHLNNKWRFQLRESRFSEIYNEKMFSKHFESEHYISDKALIKKATDLYAALNAYTPTRRDGLCNKHIDNESVTEKV
jgi:hypothetical protein